LTSGAPAPDGDPAGVVVPASSGEPAPAPPIADAQPAPTLAEHEAEQRHLANVRTRNLLRYGKVYAYGAITLMAIQIGIADAGFYLYGHAYRWKIPEGAIEAWLAAIVVQVIGVVLVIARSLFPSDTPADSN
jgi:hypothetical protein